MLGPVICVNYTPSWDGCFPFPWAVVPVKMFDTMAFIPKWHPSNPNVLVYYLYPFGDSCAIQMRVRPAVFARSQIEIRVRGAMKPNPCAPTWKSSNGPHPSLAGAAQVARAAAAGP
jgi:hypothetical protein